MAKNACNSRSVFSLVLQVVHHNAFFQGYNVDSQIFIPNGRACGFAYAKFDKFNDHNNLMFDFFIALQ
jgi:hypothetical protein